MLGLQFSCVNCYHIEASMLTFFALFIVIAMDKLSVLPLN